MDFGMGIPKSIQCVKLLANGCNHVDIIYIVWEKRWLNMFYIYDFNYL